MKSKKNMKCRKGSERIEYRIDSGTQENIALMLHDARILAVKISGREFGIKDVEIDLDSRGAMSSARRLILGSCSILHMDSLENCWWMGESIQKSSSGFCIDVECISEQDDARRLEVVCQRIVLE